MKHLDYGPDTTWLDIGCGHGWTLEAMNEVFGIEGVGLDMSGTSVEHCGRRGIEAHAGRFEDYGPRDGECYELIHSSHVIEHVETRFSANGTFWIGSTCI